MQDETQNPGVNEGAAQEPKNAPDPGVAANPAGSEGFGQDLPGEGTAAAPTEQGGSAFDLAASVGAEAVSFDPNGMAEEIRAAADIWQDTAEGLVEDAGAAFEDVGEAVEGVFDDTPSSPFWPTGLDPEVAPDSVDLSDPGLFDAEDAGPLGTSPPGPVEQEEEPIYNPLFTTPWEDLGVPSTGTVEEEEEETIFDPLFTAPPWEDVGTQPPGPVEQEEQEESIFTTPWEDAGAPFLGMDERKEEEEEEEDVFTALLQSMNEQSPGTVEQEEEPIFAAPWEDDSTAPDPDPSIFPGGWDDVLDTPPEGQEDDPNGMAEEIRAAADIWQDTAEGLVEDAGAAFEDVGEAIEDTFDDIF